MDDKLLPDEIMALTMWGEARGEKVEGQIAVANVIWNRARKNSYNVYDVCLAPRQFSCWNEFDPNYPKLQAMAKTIKSGKELRDLYYRQISFIARGVITFYLLDNTRGATHYMTTKLFQSPKRPSWAKSPLTDPLLIGNHTFFHV